MKSKPPDPEQASCLSHSEMNTFCTFPSMKKGQWIFWQVPSLLRPSKKVCLKCNTRIVYKPCAAQSYCQSLGWGNRQSRQVDYLLHDIALLSSRRKFSFTFLKYVSAMLWSFGKLSHLARSMLKSLGWESCILYWMAISQVCLLREVRG